MVSGNAVPPNAETIRDLLKRVVKDLDTLGLVQPALHVSLAIASLEAITNRGPASA